MRNITEEMVFEQLKKEWKLVDYASEHHPDLVEDFVHRFSACAEFAGRLTGERYTVTEDGVVRY